jgi:hypothetical protein
MVLWFAGLAISRNGGDKTRPIEDTPMMWTRDHADA